MNVNGAMDSAENIVTRATRLIPRYFPEDTYSILFDRREGSMPGTDLIIYNKRLAQNQDSRDSACIQCELYDEYPSILHIESLKQCELHGPTLLNQLIAFSRACGFLQITLQDGSRIVYTANGEEASISLKKLRRLMKGQGWYETFGFTNRTIVANQESIKGYINTPLGHLYPDHSNELLYRIQDYVSEVNPSIANDNTSTIMRSTSISAAVSDLYKFLTTVCPQRVCPNEDVLAVVDDIDNIVEELYQGMLARLGLNDADFISLTLTFPLKQGGSSRTRRKRARKAKRRRTRRM